MSTGTLCVLLVGIGVAAKVIWELYLSPIARQRIPGPKLAAVSDIWHTWVQIRGYRTFTFHELFERYGPVVRLGPNRVAFRNIDVVKTIYTTHDFRKSSWWTVLTFGGSQNMVSTNDPAYHTRLRRLNAPAFRNDNIRAAGNVLMHEMNALVARLRRDCADGGYVNIIQLFPQLTLDILGVTVLGVRFDQVATGQESVFAKHFESWMIDKAMIQPLPSFVRKLPIPRLQEILAGDPTITRYIEGLYMQEDEKSLEGRSSMLALYKASREAATGEPAPVSLVVGELAGMLAAGMENTATVMVCVAYHLALHEEIWKILRSELSTANFRTEDIVETLRNMPYLNAFLREMLRVRSSASFFSERLVPPGGATLDGYFLPGGTQVGGQAYSSHYDERVFPRPHLVDPLRWVRLDNTTGKYVNREDVSPEMNSQFFPFSIGVRSCVGKALADLELALITTTLVRNFRFHLHKTVTPESMSTFEVIVMRPRSRECLIRFEYAPLATA